MTHRVLICVVFDKVFLKLLFNLIDVGGNLQDAAAVHRDVNEVRTYWSWMLVA